MRVNPLSPPRPAPSAAAQAVVFATVAFLGISRLWIQGYSFGVADHSWQVPLVRGLANGGFLKDYIFNPPERLSFFFPILGFFARYARIEYVYFAGYVLASVATTLAIYLLATKMLQSRPAAFLAVILLLVGKDVAAGATTWDALLLPRDAAMPFLLFSWWSILRDKPLTAGAFMGLAFALHPISAIHGAIIAAVALAMADKRRLASLALFAGGMAVPAAITLWYILPSPAPLFEAPGSWYDAMILRNIHHIAPASVPLFAGLLLYALAVGRLVRIAGGRTRLLVAATGVTAVVCMYAGAAQLAGRALGLDDPRAALLHPPVLATLQLLRISGPLGILVLIATAGLLWKAMQEGFIARVSAVGALVAISSSHYAVGVLFLAAALLSHRESRVARTAAVLLAVTALVTALVAHKTLFMLVLGVVACAVLLTLATRTRVKAAAASLVATIVLLGIVSPHWAVVGARRAFGGAIDEAPYAGRVNIGVTGDRPMMEAAAWLKLNAAPDDVTIVPPWWEGFRVASDRPAYGLYKDGTLAFFNAGLAGSWLERMEALNVPLYDSGGSRLGDRERRFYMGLTPGQVQVAAERFPAQYVVRLEPDMPPAKLVFSGRYVSIYRIAQSGN